MQYSFSKVLITGASGFIASYIIPHLQNKGISIIGLDVNDKAASLCSYFYKLEIHSLTLIDILNKHEEIDCIIHTAGRASVPLSVIDPIGDYEANLGGTYHLLEAIRHSKIGKKVQLIFLSSAAIYGDAENLPIFETALPNPISPYGFHKRFAEDIIAHYQREHQLKAVILRIFSAYGEGLMRQVLWDICTKVSKNEEEIALHGTGEESRDFIHAEDIAQAVDLAMQLKHNTILNVANGKEIKIKDLAQMIVFASGKKTNVRFNLPPGAGTPGRWQADINQLQELGYKESVSIELGVKRFVKWFTEIHG